MSKLDENVQKIREENRLRLKDDTKYWLIVILEDSSSTDAPSGFLYSQEEDDIVLNFTKFVGYLKVFNSTKEFLADVRENGLPDDGSPILIYSMGQIGKNITRRSLLPILIKYIYKNKDIHFISGNTYALELLQNKAHYFSIAKKVCNTPQENIYVDSKKITDFDIKTDRVIIKPALENSTLGVSLVKNSFEEINSTVRNLFKEYREDVIVQEFIPGRELMVPVITYDGEPLSMQPVEVSYKNEFLDFNQEYNENYILKAYKFDKIADNIMNTSEKLAKLFHVSGISRFDFKVTDEGVPYLIDIAALPVLSHTSSVWYSFKENFDSINEMYKTLVCTELTK